VLEAATIWPRPAPCKLTFDLLTLKVVSESRVTLVTSVNFSLHRPLYSRLRPDVRDRQSDARQTDVRRASSLNASAICGRGHNNILKQQSFRGCIQKSSVNLVDKPHFRREAATICPAPCKLTFNLESGARVTCDVGYLCANFSLPRSLCS